MATTINAHARFVGSTTFPSFAEASTAGVLSQRTSVTLITRDTDTKEWVSASLASQFHPTWIGWRVSRAAAEFTISGLVTFTVYGKSSVAGSGRIHAKLYKRTVGGSDVDTFIAEADAAADLTTLQAAYIFTVTPSAPVTVAVGERLLWKIYVKRRSADFDTATFSLMYDAAAVATKFVLTETATFAPDKATLFLRRTADNGIGTFFDALLTAAPDVTAYTTGVVNTTAGGTEIPWTRTAGGTALEWISPRFNGQWVTTQAGPLTFGVNESNIAANCDVRWKLFRRQPDGTETQFMSVSYGFEIATTLGTISIQAGALTSVVFAEDDRVVCRLYIIPAPSLTMGGGRTCTVAYDTSGSGTLGDSNFSLYDIPELKAEGDPALNQVIPSGGSMSGLSNGQ